MPNFRTSDCCCFAIAAALLVGFVSLGGSLGAQNQPNQEAPAGTQDQNPFQLKVASNLVVVRVVVRDAQGKPMEGLRKEDFRLFDQGKEQPISQFEVETSAAPASSTVAVQAPGQAAPSLPPPAMPGKFLALYFDTMNTSDGDLMQARDAADRYLAANLHPNERVAIFASGEILSDFTADLAQIHNALFQLRVIPMAQARMRECPHLSDYQALEIAQSLVNEDTDAWRVALTEADQCPGFAAPPPPPPMSPSMGNSQPPPPDPRKAGIRMLAMRIVGETQVLARSNLEGLEHVVSYLSRMPSQRTIILLSPGFLSQSVQPQLDRVIDQALRSQVVISSLDSRGLAVLLREADATQMAAPSTNAIADAHMMDSQREVAATQVLAEVAYGTGGEFFHNNNDLKGGLGRLAGSPVSYTLTFVPTHVKPNGQFHAIKVTLAQKEKGVTIQARHGYFAPNAKTEAKQQTSGATSEAQALEQVRETILSMTEIHQLPVTLDVKSPSGQGDTRQLSLSAHLDATPLHLHKDGVRSFNTITFVFAVFDQKDNLVKSQATRARVNVLDANLVDFFKNGVDVDMTFQLKPGAYRIRTVVTDSEDHYLTAFSKQLTIP